MGMNYRKLEIAPPLTNACGILSYPDVFWRLEQEGARPGAWVIKSIGPAEKKGNENPTYIEGGMNSFALPCASHDCIEEELKSYKLERPMIGSVYGAKPEEYAETIKRFDKYFIAWELNVSCPNFQPGEKSVMQNMCNTERGIELASAVRKVTNKPVIAKLSPNEDYVAIANAITPFVDYIGCGNTFGPGLDIDPYTGHPVLAGQFGGVSGDAVRPLITKMVYLVRKALEDKIGIVAVGGISKAEHIVSFARAGASVFQIGTVMEKYKSSWKKADCINALPEDVEKILNEIGVSKLEEIVGVNHVKL